MVFASVELTTRSRRLESSSTSSKNDLIVRDSQSINQSIGSPARAGPAFCTSGPMEAALVISVLVVTISSKIVARLIMSGDSQNS